MTGTLRHSLPKSTKSAGIKSKHDFSDLSISCNDSCHELAKVFLIGRDPVIHITSSDEDDKPEEKVGYHSTLKLNLT